MPAIRDLDPTASPAHFFGAEVRRARMAASMTLADLAAIVPCDASTVSRIEAGEREPTERFAVACDEAFPQMTGWFTRFYLGSRKWAGPHPPWFRDWVEIEQRATEIRWWQPLLVIGLLQTPDYARAVFASWRRDNGDDIEAKVTARIERQAILSRDHPPELRVLLDESMLHRCIGNATIMAGQLDHLAEMGRRPNITIQLVPGAAGAYAGLSGAFAVATMADGQQAVYQEAGVRGMTVLDASVVSQAAIMFDDLRDEAFSRSRSLEFLAEVAMIWKQQATSADGGSQATAEQTAVTVLRSVTDNT
jgi:transcriptional regulator with XRE-family HTH domain